MITRALVKLLQRYGAQDIYRTLAEYWRSMPNGSTFSVEGLDDVQAANVINEWLLRHSPEELPAQLGSNDGNDGAVRQEGL